MWLLVGRKPEKLAKHCAEISEDGGRPVGKLVISRTRTPCVQLITTLGA